MEDISPFEPTVLGAMWRFKWLTILIAGLVTALAVGYAYLSPEKYEGVASLLVEDPQASALFDTGNIQSPQRYVADQVAILA